MNKKERPAASLLAFIADLHHEIRSPVNTILNMTEIASKEELPSSVKHYFKTIEKNANTLLTLLDDIIELSQDDMGSSAGEQVFGLTDLLEDLKEAVDGPRRAKRTHIAVSLTPKLEWFSGPRGRIRQILTQICNYCMRQLASKDIHLFVGMDNDDGIKRLVFSICAYKCQAEICEPQDALRNPRILICKRLIDEMDGELVIGKKLSNSIEFSFFMNVKLLDIPWGEPIYPRPYSCIVSKDAFSSSLISRRLSGCGFNVNQTTTFSDAKAAMIKDVSQSQKAITLVEWDLVSTESDPFNFVIHQVGEYPILFFEIPAIKMMHLSVKMPENLSGNKVGFVMAPSKGRQIVAEVARLLKMGTDQLSCPMIGLEDDFQEQLDISPEDLAGMKVLVVEDDRINQRIVVELLKKFGIKPVVASNGKAASKAVKRRRFDAIFMDINLPDTDGYRLTEKIRTLDGYGRVPIIALTASTKNRQMCLEAGMDYFLSKPYSESKLLKSLIITRGGSQ